VRYLGRGCGAGGAAMDGLIGSMSMRLLRFCTCSRADDGRGRSTNVAVVQ
jgi:hypothetical protein